MMRPELGLFGSLQREVDRLFEDFTRGMGSGNGSMLMPSMDITEKDKEIEITVELPGLERKDVDISLENNTLIIRGEKKIDTKPDEKKGNKGREQDRNLHVAERVYGLFYRAIQLPQGVDPSKVHATMSNGVLKITVEKPQQSSAAKIEVEEAA
jgi:HSP20 family protein